MSSVTTSHAGVAEVAQERTFAFSEVASFSVAFDVAGIAEILPSDSAASHFDLAAFLGDTGAAGAGHRRVVLVQSGGSPVRMRVGEQLTVETVAARDVYPLPSLVEGAATLAGVSAVICRSSGISFVLSTERILAVAERACALFPKTKPT